MISATVSIFASELSCSGDDSLRLVVQLRLSRLTLCSSGNFTLSLTMTTSRSELEDVLDDEAVELFELDELSDSLVDRRRLTSVSSASRSIGCTSVISSADVCSELCFAAL